MDSFLGPSDPSMMRVEILGDLFLLMTIGTVVAKVTILSGKLETRKVLLVDRHNWRSR